MIELKKISAGYDGVNRIERIDLCLTPGSFTAVIGPNGCGKTTLLRVMARLLPAYSGEIKIGGKPASVYEPKAFAKLVSILPQSRDIPDITVEGLVAHGRFPYLSFPRRLGPQDRDAVERASRNHRHCRLPLSLSSTALRRRTPKGLYRHDCGSGCQNRPFG